MLGIKYFISSIRKLRYKNIIKQINKMPKNIIYVDVSHLDYWWGIYGLTKNTSWEDITMYIKVGNKYKEIAWTCVCTTPYLQYGLEDLEKDPDEMNFVKEIKGFLENEDIKYHYYYDNIDDRDFYEVPFEAERNKENVKPRSIEVWYPSDGINKEVVDNCVKAFIKKFLGINVEEIKYKDIVSPEEAIEKYVEEMENWQQCKEISFSDELIETLKEEWEVPKEKVLQILNRSIK
jgi:hypothetical protein